MADKKAKADERDCERASERDILFGTDDSAIDYKSLASPVHRDLVAPFRRLRAAAAKAGIDLAIASGYRGFERQMSIWNRKAAGELPVLDDDSRVLAVDTMDEWSLAQAILRWSALPGTSRHHWGSDIDVYDRAAVGADYQLLLIPDEYGPDGPFAGLNSWLSAHLADAGAGFFRPYASDRGGVAPEPWHLSYAPLADSLQQRMTPQRLHTFLSAQPIALKSAVLAHLDHIIERYVRIPSPV